MRESIRTWSTGVILVTSASLSLFGCKKAVTTDDTASTVATAQAVGVVTKADSAKTGQVRYDEVAFGLEMLAPQSLKVGEPGTMVITLSAKSPFHVNAEYPHRFKVSSTKAANTSSSIVNSDPAKITPSKLELSIPIIPIQAGEGELEGELSFSVCTAEKCLMEKRQLRASFIAK